MYQKDSPLSIQSLFNQIAQRYDKTNSVLSFSLHKKWNRSLVNHVRQTHSPHILLDLCAGTGDIAFDYLHMTKSACQTYLIDFSSKMLENAKCKARRLPINPKHQIFYIEADVQSLPISNAFADCATMAYGIRNVQNPAICIRDVFRVLKPGGCFALLELTRPRNKFLRWGHELYLKKFLPGLGRWLTDNQQADQYLSQSIQTFITPEELCTFMKEAGFIRTRIHSLAGGIATIILGYKP